MHGLTLEIPDASDTKYGYLSNYSRYPIVIENVLYPSIIHYYYDKKFASRKFAERAKNIVDPINVKLYARKFNKLTIQNGNNLIIKENFGPNSEFYPIENWQDIKQEILFNAMRIKFDTYPNLAKRLMKTRGILLKNNKKPRIAEFLLRIRDDLIKHDLYSKSKISNKDVYTAILSDNEIKYLRKMEDLIIKIKKYEKSGKIYPGMVEDAIYNVFEQSGGKSIIDWSKSKRWNDITKNFKKLLEGMKREIFINLDTYSLLLLGVSIKFVRENYNVIDAIRVLDSLDDSSIILRPGAREYRK